MVVLGSTLAPVLLAAASVWLLPGFVASLWIPPQQQTPTSALTTTAVDGGVDGTLHSAAWNGGCKTLGAAEVWRPGHDSLPTQQQQHPQSPPVSVQAAAGALRLHQVVDGDAGAGAGVVVEKRNNEDKTSNNNNQLVLMARFDAVQCGGSGGGMCQLLFCSSGCSSSIPYMGPAAPGEESSSSIIEVSVMEESDGGGGNNLHHHNDDDSHGGDGLLALPSAPQQQQQQQQQSILGKRDRFAYLGETKMARMPAAAAGDDGSSSTLLASSKAAVVVAVADGDGPVLTTIATVMCKPSLTFRLAIPLQQQQEEASTTNPNAESEMVRGVREAIRLAYDC